MPIRKFTKDVKNEFLYRLVQCGGNRTKALQYINYTYAALHVYLKKGKEEVQAGNLKNPKAEFYQKYYEAKRLGQSVLKDEAIRRSLDGIKKGIYHNGKKVATETVYSDTLLKHLIGPELDGIKGFNGQHNPAFSMNEEEATPNITDDMSEKMAAQIYAQTIKGQE